MKFCLMNTSVVTLPFITEVNSTHIKHSRNDLLRKIHLSIDDWGTTSHIYICVVYVYNAHICTNDSRLHLQGIVGTQWGYLKIELCVKRV